MPGRWETIFIFERTLRWLESWIQTSFWLTEERHAQQMLQVFPASFPRLVKWKTGLFTKSRHCSALPPPTCCPIHNKNEVNDFVVTMWQMKERILLLPCDIFQGSSLIVPNLSGMDTWAKQNHAEGRTRKTLTSKSKMDKEGFGGLPFTHTFEHIDSPMKMKKWVNK